MHVRPARGVGFGAAENLAGDRSDLADADENTGAHIDTHPSASNASAGAIPDNRPVAIEARVLDMR